MGSIPITSKIHAHADDLRELIGDYEGPEGLESDSAHIRAMMESNSASEEVQVPGDGENLYDDAYAKHMVGFGSYISPAQLQPANDSASNSNAEVQPTPTCGCYVILSRVSEADLMDETATLTPCIYPSQLSPAPARPSSLSLQADERRRFSGADQMIRMNPHRNGVPSPSFPAPPPPRPQNENGTAGQLVCIDSSVQQRRQHPYPVAQTSLEAIQHKALAAAVTNVDYAPPVLFSVQRQQQQSICSCMKTCHYTCPSSVFWSPDAICSPVYHPRQCIFSSNPPRDLFPSKGSLIQSPATYPLHMEGKENMDEAVAQSMASQVYIEGHSERKIVSGWAPLVPLTLEEQPWFYGRLLRKETESFLRSAPSGSFLVRVSETRKAAFLLSVRFEEAFLHIKIYYDPKSKGFILGKYSQPHSTVPLLVHHYTRNLLPTGGTKPVLLKYPLCRAIGLISLQVP